MRRLSLVLTLAVLGAATVAGAAGTGDLAQKAGPSGCISDTGAGPCIDGTGLDGATSVTISPDGKNAYAASGSNVVAIFDRSSDGTLVQKSGIAGCISDTGEGPCADGSALDGASSVTVSPDGSNVYVTSSFTSSAVAVFDRAADGTLSQKPGPAGCISDRGDPPCVQGRGLSAATAVTLSPDGRSAYVTGSAGSDAVAVFDRAADGTLTQKPGTAGCISEFGTGPCADGTGLSAASSVTVSPDGRSAYVTAASSDTVDVFDRSADGTLTQKPGTAGCISDSGAGPCTDGQALIGASSVTVSPDGTSAYVASLMRGRDFTDGAVAVFDRAADGTLTQKPGAAGCIADNGAAPCADGTGLVGARSVTVGPEGSSVYVASNISAAVAVFDRGADGTLAQKPGTSGCISDSGAGPCTDGTGLDGAASVTVSPDGASVYAASFVSDAVSVFDRAAGAPPPVYPPAVDAAAPELSALSLSPARFRAAHAGASVTERTRRGARVSFRLSERAKVRFMVQRAGHRHRTVRGSFVRRAAEGLNRFAFTGRLRGRALRPGRYRLRAVATDQAGNASRVVRRRFRIVRR